MNALGASQMINRERSPSASFILCCRHIVLPVKVVCDAHE
jgi:hypothetical protein